MNDGTLVLTKHEAVKQHVLGLKQMSCEKLTALDRALTDFVTLQYVEKKVSQDATPRGGRQPREKFHKKTAQELGVSPDQIARSCRIAKLHPYVQLHVRELNLEDNQSVLLEIAASGDDVHAQTHTLARIMNRTKTGRSANESSVKNDYEYQPMQSAAAGG